MSNDLNDTFLIGEPKFDPADDGMEVFIIRETKCRSDWYYRIEVDLTRILHYREIEHIAEVERKFIQEVEALVKPSRSTDVPYF
jgi:hypothetical protein